MFLVCLQFSTITARASDNTGSHQAGSSAAHSQEGSSTLTLFSSTAPSYHRCLNLTLSLAPSSYRTVLPKVSFPNSSTWFLESCSVYFSISQSCQMAAQEGRRGKGVCDESESLRNSEGAPSTRPEHLKPRSLPAPRRCLTPGGTSGRVADWGCSDSCPSRHTGEGCPPPIHMDGPGETPRTGSWGCQEISRKAEHWSQPGRQELARNSKG